MRVNSEFFLISYNKSKVAVVAACCDLCKTELHYDDPGTAR
uniref:DUF3330 domain-containing protein n=1 Tax=Ascaris lumbricoides TaxID=6252 RepID=A0A0M3IM42_ASCLU